MPATFLHIIAIVPDGRVLMQRLVEKWEATINRVVVDLSDVKGASNTSVSSTFGPYVLRNNKTRFLTESYNKDKDEITDIYLLDIKSGTRLEISGYREIMPATLEEIAAMEKERISHKTVRVIDVLRDLRVIGRCR